MRAALLDSAILEDHDHVGTLDGGQAVSNHDAGAAFPRLVQGLLDHLSQGSQKRVLRTRVLLSCSSGTSPTISAASHRFVHSEVSGM